MEFKGTKGKWRLEQSLFYKTDKVILSEYRAICRILIEDEEAKSNALLISKAPEMLEMLSLISKTESISNFCYEDIQKLIKQATEL